MFIYFNGNKNFTLPYTCIDKLIVYAKKWASDLEVFVLTKQLLFHDNSAG